MCHFVTMVLPPGADVDHVQQVLGRHRRGFEILENRFVAKLLKPGELYFLPSPKRSMRCDCGTVLGWMHWAPADTEAPDFKSNVKKLRRKGWGEAKIARWREQKLNSWCANVRQRQEESLSVPNGDLDDWANIIRDLCADAGLGYVGILLRFYDGPLSQRFKVTRKRLQFDDDIKASLGGIEEDVLYIVS